MSRGGSTLDPVVGPIAWRGDELRSRENWVRELRPNERNDLEAVGQRFVEDNPDLRTVSASEYPLGAAQGLVEETVRELDVGRGFQLVRGLRSDEYGDALTGAIFFLLGLHMGKPMEQNQYGNLIDHVVATSDKTMEDDGALPSRVRDAQPFHSDSSDVVGLVCLRTAMEGGRSRLVSGASIYNEILARRPDLAPLLFDDWTWDWLGQDPDAPEPVYVSPICCEVDGVFSTYAGSSMILSAQDHPGVSPLSQSERTLLDLYNEIAEEPGLALEMDFKPGDIQWCLNHAVLHARAGYVDWPDPTKRRHLLRLWLRQDGQRPIADGFGKAVIERQHEHRSFKPLPGGAFTIDKAIEVNEAWGA